MGDKVLRQITIKLNFFIVEYFTLSMAASVPWVTFGELEWRDLPLETFVTLAESTWNHMIKMNEWIARFHVTMLVATATPLWLKDKYLEAQDCHVTTIPCLTLWLFLEYPLHKFHKQMKSSHSKVQVLANSLYVFYVLVQKLHSYFK